jgi:hypothetical protein
MNRSFASFAHAPAGDFVRQGDLELMAEAVVDIAPADWARFEALVNGSGSCAPRLAEFESFENYN